MEHEALLSKLKSLDCRKASGHDVIPPIFVSKCANSLVSLSLIYNESLSSGIFSDMWYLQER